MAGVDIIYVEPHSDAPFKAVATALVTEISVSAHWSLHKARARCQRKGAVSNATMAALYLIPVANYDVFQRHLGKAIGC